MKSIAIAVLLAACSSSARPTTPESSTATVEATVRAPDGVAIVYDVRGKGETALVFIHCWSCDRTYWKHQLDELAADYRVVSVDLGGHGESGDNRAEWTIASLGGDVQAVVDELGLDRVIVIGHSMGGPVALEAARRMPGRVVGVVCADTLHDAEQRMPEELRQQILAGFEADFVGTMRAGMEYMFRETSDPGVRAWVEERAIKAKPAVAIPLMRELGTHDLGGALTAAKVPVRCINAAPGGPAPVATNIEGNRKYADFDAVIMEDVGHFLQLEKPAEFNAKLRDVLAGWK
jgi:pimeloyl-ACP methyl ester carboxylesterase